MIITSLKSKNFAYNNDETGDMYKDESFDFHNLLHQQEKEVN